MHVPKLLSRFSRNELIALAVLCAIAVLAAGYQVCSVVQLYLQDQAVAREQEDLSDKVSQRHVVGESFELIGKNLPAGDGAISYINLLGWTGTLRIRVERAVLYDSIEDAEFQRDEDEEQYHGRILAVELYIENIDAKPDGGDMHRDAVFDVSNFTLATSDEYPSAPCLLRGPGVEAGCIQDSLHFSLKQGESGTYVLGYHYDDIKPHLEDGVCTLRITATSFPMGATGMSYEVGSCDVALGKPERP